MGNNTGQQFVSDTYLESGGNELKVLEYRVGNVIFGINILKVKRIITLDRQLTPLPDPDPSLSGVILDHGQIVPIINLAHYLGIEVSANDETGHAKEVLITEFFSTTNGFEVSSVANVHTILWDNVFDAKESLGNFSSEYMIGMARPSQDLNIWLLDYEKIILELSPSMALEQHAEISTKIEGAGRKILIAEDSEAVRNMLTVELEDKGFKVITACDGVEGWEEFQKHSDIFLVLCDVEMPQMDGLALTKKIKDQSDSSLVIVYSSIGDIGMKSRAEFLKADAHVTKLNLEELMATISKFSEQSVAAKIV